MGSTPELCSGFHQRGCDLEGVEGATPHTLIHFKIMNFQNDLNPDISEELSLEEMSEINAGLGPLITIPLIASLVTAAKVGAAKAAIGVVGSAIGWTVGETVYRHVSGEKD